MAKLDLIENISPLQRWVMIGLLFIIILGGFFYFVYMPKAERKKAIDGELSRLVNEININMTKARTLEDLKKQNAELQRQLSEKKEQLPSESEAETLLKQISDVGAGANLDIKLWKPGERRQSPDGLYIELPVSIEITGGYHSMAIFFDRIGKFPRIVNISNLRIASAKAEKDKIILQSSFTATAFASTEGKK
ncbi:MAG TPA: type 4a pilus biogenesis protein PilO [Nitrospiria bacterium]|nr:type 4a pilus biogenesis protein PilO [Nitrospiria bacterium]